MQRCTFGTQRNDTTRKRERCGIGRKGCSVGLKCCCLRSWASSRKLLGLAYVRRRKPTVGPGPGPYVALHGRGKNGCLAWRRMPSVGPGPHAALHGRCKNDQKLLRLGCAVSGPGRRPSHALHDPCNKGRRRPSGRGRMACRPSRSSQKFSTIVATRLFSAPAPTVGLGPEAC